MKKINVRPSSCPLASKCAGAIALSQISPSCEAEDKDANSGTVAHDYLARVVKGETPKLDDLDENTKKPIINGWAMWSKGSEELGLLPLKHYCNEENLQVEVFLKHKADKGTADILSYRQDKTLVLMDWKTGFRKRDAESQLMKYAWIYCKQEGIKPENILLFALYPRLFDWECYQVTIEEIESNLSIVEKNAEKASKWLESPGRDLSIFNEGPHCETCNNLIDCPAKKRALLYASFLPEKPAESALDSILSTSDGQLTTETAKKAYIAAKWMEQLSKNIRLKIHEFIEVNGPVDFDKKKQIAITEQTRIELDSKKAIPVLLNIEVDGELVFDREFIISVCKLSISDIKKQIKSKAPKGKKKELEDSFIDLLESKKCLTKKTTKVTKIINRKED